MSVARRSNPFRSVASRCVPRHRGRSHPLAHRISAAASGVMSARRAKSRSIRAASFRVAQSGPLFGPGFRNCTSTSGSTASPQPAPACPDSYISRGPTGLSVYASSVLFTRPTVSRPFGRSAAGAALDTGGWLTLTRRGLAPRKIRQASLGAIPPALTRRAQNAPVPACPVGLAAPVGWSALFGSPLALLVRAHLGACPRCSDPHQCRASEFHNRLRTGSNSEAAPDSPPPTSGTTPAVPKSFDHPSGPR